MERDRQPRPRRMRVRATCGVFIACGLLVGLSATCGCRAESATVVGKVSYRGKPVTSGVVVFIDTAGRATMPASVQGDGSYRIKVAPLGAVKVSFDNLAPPPVPKLPPASPAAEDPEIEQMAKAHENYTSTPAKYKDPAASGITFDLKPGENVCNLDLK